MKNFVGISLAFLLWPFDPRFHLIMNLAVGGNWGAFKGLIHPSGRSGWR